MLCLRFRLPVRIGKLACGCRATRVLSTFVRFLRWLSERAKYSLQLPSPPLIFGLVVETDVFSFSVVIFSVIIVLIDVDSKRGCGSAGAAG